MHPSPLFSGSRRISGIGASAAAGSALAAAPKSPGCSVRRLRNHPGSASARKSIWSISVRVRVGYPEVMDLAMTYEDAKGGRSSQAHSLSLSDRRRLTVSGVEDVDRFDEDAVSLVTCAGTLNVRGSGLKIEKLSLDGGELVVEGRIDSLDYSENTPGRRGWIGRLLG